MIITTLCDVCVCVRVYMHIGSYLIVRVFLQGWVKIILFHFFIQEICQISIIDMFGETQMTLNTLTHTQSTVTYIVCYSVINQSLPPAAQVQFMLCCHSCQKLQPGGDF